MIVIGIDPGVTGALARFDSERNELDIVDMPTWKKTVGRRKLDRVDELGLRDYFTLQKLLGFDLAVLEAVSGIPKQSAPNAFAFGEGYGLIKATMTALYLPWEDTPASTWKARMRVPKDDAGILHAFLQRWPQHRGLVEGRTIGKGERKGQKAVKDGRAEAALLAMFGATYLQGKRE